MTSDEECPHRSGLHRQKMASYRSLASPALSDGDDDEVPLSFKRARTYVGNRPSAATNPVIVGNTGKAPLCFKKASASVKNGPSVVNPVLSDNDEYDDPKSFKRATTLVKNRTWGANAAIFDSDDDDVPLSVRRASTSVKYKPTLSKQKVLEPFSVEDSEGKAQKGEYHAKPGSANGGRPKNKRKVITFMGQKVSLKGQQYSISRCLEVLHGMSDVSDEIKVLDSDVLKDAASREFFLCYESALRGLWLKKEVAKLGAQLPPCK